jgi:hypothetical protein
MERWTNRREAHLARVEEDRERCADAGLHEIGIGEDERGRLAAQLQRDALQVARRRLDDLLADPGRSGERDLVDPGMLDRRLACLMAITSHHVQHAFGKARFQRQLRQP